MPASCHFLLFLHRLEVVFKVICDVQLLFLSHFKHCVSCIVFSGELEQYLKYIVKLGYDEEPDYNKLRKIFQDGLRKRRFTDDGKTVKFTAGELQDSKPKEKSSVEEKESDESLADKVSVG